MNKYVLKRIETSDEGTFGMLKDTQGFTICYTGELPRYGGNPDIENERKVDCIIAGTYVCKIKTEWSRFGHVYRLENVPNRSEILIHAGNYCGNKAKGYKSDVEGCILLGTEIGKLGNQQAVKNSKVALTAFMKLLADQPFLLEIKWI